MEQPFPEQCASRFRCVRSLASGGHGQVFLAMQIGLDRPVVVKLLAGGSAPDEEAQQRFKAEARIAAAIVHENVARVIDCDVESDVPWIAYEFVPGADIRSHFSRGPMAVELCVEVAVQVLAGLSAAHERGVVHRDIKPENVLVASPQLFKITDFGIARWAGGVRTAAGIILGTPAYIAPEVVLGKEIDLRADLYSTGILLFEMLTGRPPFEDKDVCRVLSSHVEALPPRPGELRQGLAPALDRIVARALAKEPGDRFPTAAHMRQALLELPPAPVAARPPLGSPAQETATERVDPRARTGTREATAKVCDPHEARALDRDARLTCVGPGREVRPAPGVRAADAPVSPGSSAWLRLAVAAGLACLLIVCVLVALWPRSRVQPPVEPPVPVRPSVAPDPRLALPVLEARLDQLVNRVDLLTASVSIQEVTRGGGAAEWIRPHRAAVVDVGELIRDCARSGASGPVWLRLEYLVEAPLQGISSAKVVFPDVPSGLGLDLARLEESVVAAARGAPDDPWRRAFVVISRALIDRVVAPRNAPDLARVLLDEVRRIRRLPVAPDRYSGVYLEVARLVRQAERQGGPLDPGPREARFLLLDLCDELLTGSSPSRPLARGSPKLVVPFLESGVWSLKRDAPSSPALEARVCEQLEKLTTWIDWKLSPSAAHRAALETRFRKARLELLSWKKARAAPASLATPGAGSAR